MRLGWKILQEALKTQNLPEQKITSSDAKNCQPLQGFKVSLKDLWRSAFLVGFELPMDENENVLIQNTFLLLMFFLLRYCTWKKFPNINRGFSTSLQKKTFIYITLPSCLQDTLNFFLRAVPIVGNHAHCVCRKVHQTHPVLEKTKLKPQKITMVASIS